MRSWRLPPNRFRGIFPAIVTSSSERKLDEFNKPTVQLISRRTLLLGLTGLGLGLSGLNSKTEAAVGLYEPFSFAFVSDVHLTTGQSDNYRLLQESQLFLQDVVKTLNNEKLNFVIFGGDQVEGPGKDEANWNLFIDVVQTLNHPWNFVLGETDVSGPSVVDKKRTYGPDWKGKGLDSDNSYWSQDPLPGVHIIGLDTSRPNSNTGDISNAQLDWLKEDLKTHARRFTIVFSHHPLLPPSPYDGGPPWEEYTCAQGANVREIIGGSKYVKLAVNGHIPVSKIQKEGDIWYVSCPGVSVYPCAFRIFRLTPDAVTVETYQISYGALVKKARKLLLESKMAFNYSSRQPDEFAILCEGTKLDQNAVLPLIPGKPIEPHKVAKKKKQKKEKVKKEKPEPKNTKDKAKGTTDSKSKSQPQKEEISDTPTNSEQLTKPEQTKPEQPANPDQQTE